MTKNDETLTIDPIVDGPLFVTDDFSSISQESIELVSRDAPARLIISSVGETVELERADRLGSNTVASKAMDASERTGGSVAIAELAGFDKAGRPVWRQSARVTKAQTDALSDEAYLSWVSRLSKELAEIARIESRSAIDEAMEWLDFDYLEETQSRIERAVARVRETLSVAPRGMITAQRAATAAMASTILRRVTAGIARTPMMRRILSERLIPSLSLPDKRISEAMARNLGFWVRNQYRQRSPSIARSANTIIQRGIAQGLGRGDIGRMLRRQLGQAYPMRNYWQAVAHNAVARARSFALGRSYQHAGITHFRIEAVMDERTTETCRFLHGKIIPVDQSVARLERAMNDPNPEGVLWHTPFVSEGRGPEGQASPSPDVEHQGEGNET